MYKIVIVNSETGEHRQTNISYKSRKMAEEWIRRFKSATRNADAYITKE